MSHPRFFQGPFLAGTLQGAGPLSWGGLPFRPLAGGLVLLALALAWWLWKGRTAQGAFRRREAQALARAQARDLEAQVAARTAALRESEARVQGFIRHAPAAIALKGPEGRLLLVNRRAEALMGRFPAVTPDRSLQDLFPPEVVDRARERDEQVLLRREATQVEEQLLLPSGETQDYLVQRFPLVDALGHCWGLGVMATDITGRRLLEQAHLHRRKLEAMGLLAGGIAHDFNNILSAMMGNLDLARLEPDSGEAFQALESLITRASLLVSRVLTYTGKGQLQVQTLDLNPLAEDLVRLLRASLRHKASLLWDPAPDLPPMAGDPAQIRQVILDLVFNAAEALGPEGGTVTLRTGTETLAGAYPGGPYQGLALEAGPYVLLEVSDTGAGISSEVQERIFDPFFSTKPGGRGVGLSGVQGIVEEHHGGLRVLGGEGGRGTTFRLLFPAMAAGGGPEVREGTPEEAYRGTGTVLVVDDEAAVRAVAVRALRRMGFDTLEARDGQEGLRVFEAHWDRIRLVLMDLTMPRMGGEEACRELRRSGALAPVILSSGFTQDEALRRFRSMAPAGFLQKPYPFQALEAAVREALEGGGGFTEGRGTPPRALVAWIPEFETGHALLDAQHKALVRAFNRLVAATEDGGGEVPRALEALIQETIRHFATEEGLMASAAFPALDEHRAAHGALLDQVRDLAMEVNAGGITLTFEVMNFLEDWLLNHLQTEDLVLARHLRGS